ncbi:hypothetical protein [Halobacillus seohaensis]|uniref:DUF4829 domain-containing protein n=1 Tax=Halobacillus seohaensis TaxID=447421 RepID=A0ABW2EM00_9BACI
MKGIQRKKLLIFVIITVFSLSVWLISYISYLLSPGHQSYNVVEEFYTHEQAGDFADSWELLHPLMKERWSKGVYLQDRPHVFINHFGANTFTFTIEKDGKVNDWRMEKESSAFDVTYKFNVTQSYNGKYGKFGFFQEVYVAKDKGEWRILWDYN